MIKGFRQIALLTTFSRVLGMARDMFWAYFLGRSRLMDIWVIAFKIPNLARRVFGEGALSSSLLPVYMEQQAQDHQAAQRLANTVLTVLVLGLTAVILVSQVIIVLYSRYRVNLSSTELLFLLVAVMLPYTIMICSVATVAGILQAHRHFACPALAPVALNVVIIASLMISGWAIGLEPEEQLGFVAMGVLLAGVLQVLLQIPGLRICGISIRPCWQVNTAAFKKVMLLMGPMILGTTVTQLNTLSDDVIAKILSASQDKGDVFTLFFRVIHYPVAEGSVSSLFYSQRLYQFPLGVLGISLATAIFPVMSADAARRDRAALTATVARGMRGAVFVAVPATAGLFLVAGPLVAAIFEQGQFTREDTPFVARTLMFYAVGLCGYFMQQILTRAFYAIQDSQVPYRSALVAVGANIGLNLLLIWPLGTGGLALATALCSYLQVVLLAYALHRRLGTSVVQGFLHTLFRCGLATVGMMLAGWGVLWAMHTLPETRGFQCLRLGLVVPVAAGVYSLAALFLQIEEMALVTGKSKAGGAEEVDA